MEFKQGCHTALAVCGIVFFVGVGVYIAHDRKPPVEGTVAAAPAPQADFIGIKIDDCKPNPNLIWKSYLECLRALQNDPVDNDCWQAAKDYAAMVCSYKAGKQ